MVYPFNPQVHAFDDLSVMETLEAQVATVETARRFCDGPIHVGPITLRPRFIPGLAQPADDARAENALPAAVDPRQRELIAAAWTVGTLANLLGCEQVASLTFFETVGCKGVLAGTELLPAGFGAQPSEIYPVYHVFRALADATKLLGTGRNAQFAWLCFCARDRKTGALVANLRPEISQLQFRAPPRATSVEVRLLDRSGVRPGQQPTGATIGRFRGVTHRWAATLRGGGFLPNAPKRFNPDSIRSSPG